MAMEYWSPKGEGSAFELSPILEPLAPFRNQMLVLSGLKANWNYIHAGASGIVSDRHAARRTKRDRDHRGRVDGPAARAGTSRSETQVASLELVDGRPGQRRRVHRQPELRLHAHALVAQPDAAAADGVESARGVREAVRRQRQHGSGGARSAAAAAQEHSRFGDREAGRASSGSSGRRTRSRSTNTPRRFATSNGAFRRPRNSATSSCRRWSSRRARRRSSKITWR